MQNAGRYLTARQAADALGVTLPTLYAYASRGRLRSDPVPGRTRARRYYREDIERLRERKEIRANPAMAAARGLHWGDPVLESAITLIRTGRLYYRGRDAVQLAQTATLEEAAGLLWGADEVESHRLFAQPATLPVHPWKGMADRAKNPLVRLQTALPLAGDLDLSAYDLRPEAVRQTGARILRLAPAIIAGRDSQKPMHLALQAAWAPRRPAVAEVIRMALVLCADHELNVSAFTARCAASAGASPYDTVAAALATVKGSRHGGETERVAALLAEARTPKRARAVMAARLRRGERLPGFGHPLYPDGDPRAEQLMALAKTGLAHAQWELVHAVAAAARQLLHDRPNVDFGLVALARTWRLPESAPLVLFALGRTAGWIAHAIEQYASGELIRPRASYTGPTPISP